MKRILLFLIIGFMMMNGSSFAQDKASQKVVKFVIHTEYGDMKGILYNETPQHRDNFVKLVKSGYYDGTLFHRVMLGFMIQGGDPDSKTAAPGARLGTGGPGYTIPAEIKPSLFHKKGALAAARQADQVNPQKASSGSQFYISQGKKYSAAQLTANAQKGGLSYTPEQMKAYETVGGIPFLDGAYTVFGEITEGLDVIDKIAAVATDASNRPTKDVKMTIKLIE